MRFGNMSNYVVPVPPAMKLTPVEARIWSLLQEGKTYDEVAAETGMKRASVMRRLTEIKEKVACQ